MIRHASKWVLLVSLIMAAILSIAGRMLVANVEYFKAEIEQELADYGITGVSLDNISGSWQGIHPLLRIRGASLSIPGRSQALSVDQLELSVKLIPSLLESDLKLEAFHASVIKMILVHDRYGRWWLNDIPLSRAATDSNAQIDILAFFQRLPDFVNIEINLLQIRDQLQGIDHLVQRGSLKSSRREGQMVLSLNARLPQTLGKNFALHLKGDARTQRIHINADDLNLLQFLPWAGFSPPAIQQARLSLQSWIDLHQLKPVGLHHIARLHDVRLGYGDNAGQPLRASVMQKWEPAANGWNIASRVEHVFHGERQLAGLNSRIHLADNHNARIWLDSFRLGEIREVLLPLVRDDDMRRLVAATRAEAKIENLVASINIENPSQSSLSLEFDDFHSVAYADIPGIDSVSGRLFAKQGGMHVDITQAPLNLSFTSLFREPLQAEHFSAAVDFTWLEGGMLLDASHFELRNADIQVDGRAWMEIPWQGTPFLSLRASYRNGNAAATGRYLPVSIMPSKTVDWLDRSILGGEITQGGLLFFGRLVKIPRLQEDSAGVFHALFDIQNPQVKFLPEWPAASRGKGRVSFHNLGMDLSFSDVGFSAASLEQVNVSIDSFLNPELKITGVDTSPAKIVLQTLSSLPVLPVAGEVLQRQTRLEGSASTRLQLDIPLKNVSGRTWSLSATAELSDVGMMVPDWMVDFDQVNGVLSVKNEQVTAGGLRGLYAGRPATLDVRSNAQHDSTDFRLRGDLDIRSLTRLLPAYLSQPLSGNSAWDIELSVAHHPSPQTRRFTVSGRTDLVGVASAFPAPFELKPDSSHDLQVSTDLSFANDLEFEVSHQGSFNLAGKVRDIDKPSAALDYLQLAFARELQADRQNGIHLHGRVEQVDLEDWNRYVDRYFVKQQNLPTIHQQLQAVDLGIDRLDWVGQRIHDSKIRILNNGERLMGQVDSSLARGTFQVPYVMDSENPVVAELDYLQLHKPVQDSTADEKAPYRIDRMPTLNIHSKIASYEDMVFADFDLQTEKTSDRFIIRQLDFERDEVYLESSGHWQYDADTEEHVTVFNIQVNGRQFGAAVDGLGLGNTIRNGVVEFEGQIGWGGTLFDINWPTLIGEVDLQLTDGYLNNVEPGAGRFVGLLSLNALPKRLFLDFGDVLSEGMQFDEIKGQFSINGEIMTTDNATMRGASAKVKLFGETNLREQTYDQTMIIIPRVGDTLPVLGSIAAGNAVGWGLLLIQRIFKNPIEKSVEIEYKVSGSWSDPVIQLVSEPEAVQQPDEDEFIDENP